MPIFIAHTGGHLSPPPPALADATLGAYIASETEIPPTSQILLSSTGEIIKPSTLASAVAPATAVFLYDKDLLAKYDPENPAELVERLSDLDDHDDYSDSDSDLEPGLPAGAAEDSLSAWKEAFAARQNWAGQRLAGARALADTAVVYASQQEVVRSAALVAILSQEGYVGLLSSKADSIRAWFDSVEQEFVTHDLKARLQTLQTIAIKRGPESALFRPGKTFLLDEMVFGETNTLYGIVQQWDIEKGTRTIEQSRIKFRKGLEEIVTQMNDLEERTADTMAIIQAGISPDDRKAVMEEVDSLVAELGEVVETISSGCEGIICQDGDGRDRMRPEMRARVSRLVAEQKTLLPKIGHLYKQIERVYRQAGRAKEAAAEQFFGNMNTISGLQSECDAAKVSLKAVALPPDALKAYGMLATVRNLPRVWGRILVESVRRAEWSQIVLEGGQAVREEVRAGIDEEIGRRQRWDETLREFLSEELSDGSGDRMTQVNVDIGEFSPVQEEAWPVVSRAEMADYIEQLERMDGELADIGAELRTVATTELDVSSISATRIFVAREEIEMIVAERSRLEEEVRSQKSRVRKLEEMVYRAEADRDEDGDRDGLATVALGELVGELERQGEELRVELSAKEEELRKKEEELAEKSARFEQLQKEASVVADELRSTRERLEKSTESLQATGESLRAMTAEFENLRKRSEVQRTVIADKNRQVAEQAEQKKIADELKERMSVLEDRIRALEAEKGKLADDAKRSEEKAAEKETALERATARLAESTAKIEKLEKAASDPEVSTERDALVESALREQNTQLRNGLAAVLARLGPLAERIDEDAGVDREESPEEAGQSLTALLEHAQTEFESAKSEAIEPRLVDLLSLLDERVVGLMELVDYATARATERAEMVRQAHREGAGKVAIRNLCVGDLALFLPKKDKGSAGEEGDGDSWIAFTTDKAVYMLDHKPTKAWMVGRVSRITERNLAQNAIAGPKTYTVSAEEARVAAPSTPGVSTTTVQPSLAPVMGLTAWKGGSTGGINRGGQLAVDAGIRATSEATTSPATATAVLAHGRGLSITSVADSTTSLAMSENGPKGRKQAGLGLASGFAGLVRSLGLGKGHNGAGAGAVPVRPGSSLRGGPGAGESLPLPPPLAPVHQLNSALSTPVRARFASADLGGPGDGRAGRVATPAAPVPTPAPAEAPAENGEEDGAGGAGGEPSSYGSFFGSWFGAAQSTPQRGGGRRPRRATSASELVNFRFAFNKA